MAVYVSDNNDVYAGSGSGGEYGFDPSDWIYWRGGTYTPNLPDGTPATLKKSPLVASLGASGSTNMFLCPMDQDNSFRLNPSYSQDSTAGPYMYSYEFTSYDIITASGQTVGFTTIVDHTGKSGRAVGTAFLFKSTRVRSPGTKMMAVEPVAALTSSDAPAIDTTWVAQTARWEPFGQPQSGTTVYSTAPANYLTVRHSKRSDACFADGHAEGAGQNYATNYMYSCALY